MPFDLFDPFDLDDLAVVEARYRTRCGRCRKVLQPGIEIFSHPVAWSCYACYLEAG